MGVLIHYCGNLRDPASLTPFANEMIDICQSLKWDHKYISPQSDDPVEGVIIYPGGGEPVVLTFLPGGRLCHPMFYPFIRQTANMADFETAQVFIVAETLSPDIHMELMKVLHYLDDKYFENFTLDDDSQYWETSNEDQCRKYFAVKEEGQPLRLGSRRFKKDRRSRKGRRERRG